MSSVESLLSLVVERVEIAAPDRLAELIGPLMPIEVDLPADVVDSATFGSGIVTRAGPQTLRTSVAVDQTQIHAVGGQLVGRRQTEAAGAAEDQSPASAFEVTRQDAPLPRCERRAGSVPSRPCP